MLLRSFHDHCKMSLSCFRCNFKDNFKVISRPIYSNFKSILRDPGEDWLQSWVFKCCITEKTVLGILTGAPRWPIISSFWDCRDSIGPLCTLQIMIWWTFNVIVLFGRIETTFALCGREGDSPLFWSFSSTSHLISRLGLIQSLLRPTCSDYHGWLQRCHAQWYQL